MNMYAYVRGDPVNATDPSGLLAHEINRYVQPIDPGEIVVIGNPLSCRACFMSPGLLDANPGLTPPGSGPGPGGDSGGVEVEEIVVTCDAACQKKHAPPKSHKYALNYLSPCPAPAVFGYFKQAGHSAPGALAAREGFTPRVILNGGNPISQFVNSPTGTIINTALQGHRYFPGTVTIQVKPLSMQTSTITITGVGTGAHSEENVITGTIWFAGAGIGAAAPEVCGK
jgi:hypothetical protein